MEIEEDYKQTEVGVIPKDWEVKKLGLLVNNVEYGSAAKSKYTGAVPVLRMGNMQNGKFDYTDLVYTDDENEIKKYLLTNDDVLFNRTNTVDLVGKTAIYKGERPAVFAGYLIRININKDLLDADYLNYWLNTKSAKNYGYTVLSVAVSQANINGAKLKTYPISLPPTKAEQTAIATALSDTDALISRLETLIEKKRAIKQGAMQQLLKPKEGWIVKKLGDMALSISSGKSNTESQGDTFPIYGSTGIIGWKNLSDYSGNKILVARVGANAGTINKVSGNYSVSDNTLMISLDNTVDLDFIFFKLLNYKLNSLVFGSGQPLITGGQLKELYLEIPHKTEQTRIAQILSDMDAEIAGLEQKLAKYKLVKQGMMQELLTGKTRLV
jgi:type I restriction enzyme S subunit